jgi:hypothetical protein
MSWQHAVPNTHIKDDEIDFIKYHHREIEYRQIRSGNYHYLVQHSKLPDCTKKRKREKRRDQLLQAKTESVMCTVIVQCNWVYFDWDNDDDKVTTIKDDVQVDEIDIRKYHHMGNQLYRLIRCFIKAEIYSHMPTVYCCGNKTT